MNNNELMGKIILGTAQFGFDYGIINQRGQIPEEECFSILEKAAKNKIGLIDTAFNYGESERIIGRHGKRFNSSFSIISKLPICSPDDVEGYLYKSLSFLNVDTLYGYLIHDFKTFLSHPNIWDKLKKFKKRGKIKKIGFSLYYPEEIAILLERQIDFDLLQIPFNILDRRFDRELEMIKALGIEIHVRSIFLQGLVFSPIDKLVGKLKRVRSKIKLIKEIADENRFSVAALCLYYVLANENIDKVIIGVDSLENFDDLISITNKYDQDKHIKGDISAVQEEDEDIILPFNWGKILAERGGS